MAEEASAKPEEKGSSGFDIKIIAIGLVVFMAAMAGSYFIAKSILSPLLPKEEVKQTTETGEPMAVGEFTININDPSGTRYLKTEVYVEVSDAKMVEEKAKYMPIIRDQVLSVLATKTVEDLDISHREALKTEIKKKLNRKLEDKVTNVYFTTFIMQ